MRQVWQKDKLLSWAIMVTALAMVIYQLITARTHFQEPMEVTITHGGFALSLIFLSSLRKGKRKLWLWYGLMLALAVGSIGYVLVNYHTLITTKAVLDTAEVIVGIILIIVFWEATREGFGLVIPLITIVVLLYVFVGQYAPYPFWHIQIPLNQVVATTGIGLASNGVFGTVLNISANYVFLFVVFGVLLEISGAVRFFMEVAKIPGRWLAGGPAMTAVVSSCLVGTCTGSGMANVAITGPFTIPLMKKVGYTAAQAGGIETAASTGGSIMPPVMGIVAFVMAEFTHTPYLRLITMAIIPAILYYLCIALFVHFQALKLRVKRMKVAVNKNEIILGAPIFFIPMAVLLTLLVMGRSLRFCVFFLIVSMVVMALLRKETRGNIKRWTDGLTKGAILGAQIAVVSGILGVMLASLDLTGLAVRLPTVVNALSHGILPLALFLVALVTIILGCGVPPFAAYLLVAILCAPALIKLGIPFMQAHFYIYYFATFALMTPPVGLAAVVAAPIAGAPYIKTAMEGVRAGVVAWFLPVMVIGAPVIILQPMVEPILAIPKLIACFGMVLLLQNMLVGYYFTDLSLWTRVIAGTGAALFLVFIFNVNFILFAAGLLVVIMLTVQGLAARKRLALATVATPAS